MKYIKFQQDFISDWLRSKVDRLSLMETENEWVFIKESVAICIPKAMTLLDMTKIKAKFAGELDLKRLYREDGCLSANYTGNIKKNRNTPVTEKLEFAICWKLLMKTELKPTSMKH